MNPNQMADVLAYWLALAPFWLPLWLLIFLAAVFVRRIRPKK